MAVQCMEKTLLVTLDFPPLTGGVANYYLNRVKKMPSDKVAVLMNGLEIRNQKLEIRDFKIYYKFFFTKLIWPHWLPLIWQVYKIAKKENAKILWAGQILPVGTAVYVVSKLLRLPYCISCHGNDLLRAKQHLRKYKLARKILQKAEYVEANTQFTKNILIKDFGINGDKVKIVYPECDLSKKMVDKNKVQALQKKYNLDGKKVLLTVARLVKSKGISQVLTALEQVWQIVPDLHYLIIGDGPDKNRLIQIVGRLPRAHRSKIIFVGAVPHTELPNYYGLADIFILTPRKIGIDTESFGIVYLEALEFNLPVIAGNVGGVKEIKHNKIILVDSENVGEIAREIKSQLLK